MTGKRLIEQYGPEQTTRVDKQRREKTFAFIALDFLAVWK
jgi:hypothetical protein